jgi:PEGA domain-containing protein
MARMIRSTMLAAAALSLGASISGMLPGLEVGVAFAQTTQERPRIHGRAHRLTVDSSPQQATVFWDSGDRPDPKSYGVAGYTPLTLKVPRGSVKILIELAGFKPQEQTLDVRKSQKLMFTLERAPQMAHLDLQTAADSGGVGAEVFIDGVDRGTAPNAFELTAGRHQVEVRKPGFKPFSDWFDLAEGERRTRDVALERAEAPTGTLLVTSDSGGDVYLDGGRKDVAPAILTGIAAGDHVVEVRKEGSAPWRQTVTVIAGQQVRVAATFGPPAGVGASLRVISNEPDVDVFVDGEDKGKAPLTISDIKPGEHIVGGRKPKFKPQEQTIRVAPSENAIVSFRMELAPVDRPHAALKVQSTIPNAEVFVDGSSLGRAPIDRSDLDPGKHFVVVHRDGFTDFKREIFLVENQAVALVADLSATGALRILSTPEGAEVRIDGELIGHTPVQHDGVSSGDHIVEFRLKGYFDHKETMKVEGGREKVFSVDLKLVPTGPSPEQVAKRKQGMSSFGARVNPVGGVTADFGVGYPYYLTARVMVGALAIKNMGLDVGVQVQTLFDITDFALRGRFQPLDIGPFALGTEGDLGFGTGVNGRDSYFLDWSGIASLAFSDVATVSAFFHVSAWTDRFCPTAQQMANGVDADAYCGADPGKEMANFGTSDPNSPIPTQRFSGKRFYVGFSAAAALDRLTSLFFQFEFVPLTDSYGFTARQAFEGTFNQTLFASDPNFYFVLGVSLKF